MYCLASTPPPTLPTRPRHQRRHVNPPSLPFPPQTSLQPYGFLVKWAGLYPSPFPFLSPSHLSLYHFPVSSPNTSALPLPQDIPSVRKRMSSSQKSHPPFSSVTITRTSHSSSHLFPTSPPQLSF